MAKKKQEIWEKCQSCKHLNKKCPEPLPKLKDPNNPHICMMYDK